MLKRSEAQLGMAKQDCRDLNWVCKDLKQEAQQTNTELEVIEEVTRKSLADCAELKRLFKGAISTYRDQKGIAIQVLEDVLDLCDSLAKYVLEKGVGDIENVLNRNTKCINRGLCRLRAKMEENTQTFVPQATEEDEKYTDNSSSEDGMGHLEKSPPITLMELGGMYSIGEATQKVTMDTNADKENFRIIVSSPLGSKARVKILDIQESVIVQGMPSAKRSREGT